MFAGSCLIYGGELIGTIRHLCCVACVCGLIIGCTAPHLSPPTPVARVKVTHPILGDPQQRTRIINSLNREQGCKHGSFEAARTYAARWLDMIVSVPGDKKKLREATENGRFRLLIAEAAARRKCYDAAKESFIDVKEIFTGEPYSRLQKRADAGLSLLPSDHHHDVPAE